MKNKENAVNITECRSKKICKDKLVANSALKGINKYIRSVRFDGGRLK